MEWEICCFITSPIIENLLDITIETSSNDPPEYNSLKMLETGVRHFIPKNCKYCSKQYIHNCIDFFVIYFIMFYFKVTTSNCFNPLTPKGFPFDEKNCLAVARVKSIKSLLVGKGLREIVY